MACGVIVEGPSGALYIVIITSDGTVIVQPYPTAPTSE